MKRSKTKLLIEAALMVALATILSILKFVEMPYGGSVTAASMLPIVILAYRNGTAWGLGAGIVYATLQQLLGLKTLSYFTTWQSIVAIILIDYIIAFTLVGLGGIFRTKKLSQRSSLLLSAIFVSLLRYVCHTISGATVWAGLSIPTEAALIYSIGYNATYMLPECIVLASTAYYLGGVIDFTRAIPARIARSDNSSDKKGLGYALGGLSLLVGLIIDVILIAPHTQNGETGLFDMSGLSDVNWIFVAVATAVALALAVVLFFISKSKKTKAN